MTHFPANRPHLPPFLCSLLHRVIAADYERCFVPCTGQIVFSSTGWLWELLNAPLLQPGVINDRWFKNLQDPFKKMPKQSTSPLKAEYDRICFFKLLNQVADFLGFMGLTWMNTLPRMCSLQSSITLMESSECAWGWEDSPTGCDKNTLQSIFIGSKFHT